MIALVDGAMRGGTNQSLLTDYPLVYRESNLSNVYILRVDGEMAAVVPFIPREIEIGGASFRMGIISPTATAPQYRHQGYGTLCLRSAIEGMKRVGCEISVLWTRCETFPFYELAGWQPVGNQGWMWTLRCRDSAVFAAASAADFSRRAMTDSDLPAIRALHERDPCGVRRTMDEYHALFHLPKMEHSIAEHEGRPIAYLTWSNAVNKPGVIETGGEAVAVAHLLSLKLATLADDTTVTAWAPLTRNVLGGLLDLVLPGRRQAEGAGMMIRLNSPGDLIGRLASSWPEAALRDLVSALFGAHPVKPSEPPEYLPIYFPIWLLDRS